MRPPTPPVRIISALRVLGSDCLLQTSLVPRCLTLTCRMRPDCMLLPGHSMGMEPLASPSLSDLTVQQAGEPGGPPLADEHAEGTWGQHYSRQHQGLPLEDVEEWPSRPWVGLLCVERTCHYNRANSPSPVMVTVCSGARTRASSLSRSSAILAPGFWLTRSSSLSRRCALFTLL